MRFSNQKIGAIVTHILVPRYEVAILRGVYVPLEKAGRRGRWRQAGCCTPCTAFFCPLPSLSLPLSPRYVLSRARSSATARRLRLQSPPSTMRPPPRLNVLHRVRPPRPNRDSGSSFVCRRPPHVGRASAVRSSRPSSQQAGGPPPCHQDLAELMLLVVLHDLDDLWIEHLWSAKA